MSRFEELAKQAAECVRKGKGTQEAFEALAHAAEESGAESLLVRQVDKLLAEDRMAGQFAVRACRSAFSIAPFAEKQSLVLLALPCVVNRWQVEQDPGKLAAEIQGWMSSQRLGLSVDMRVAVAATPLPVTTLAGGLGKSQVSWAHNLSVEGTQPGSWLGQDKYTPALWLVALRVASADVDLVQAKLWRPAQMDMPTSTFKHRLEALAEEQGSELRIYPPSAWHNAFSLARITAFRARLVDEINQRPPGSTIELRYDGRDVVEQGAQGQRVVWASFPEEPEAEVYNLVASGNARARVQVDLRLADPKP